MNIPPSTFTLPNGTVLSLVGLALVGPVVETENMVFFSVHYQHSVDKVVSIEYYLNEGVTAEDLRARWAPGELLKRTRTELVQAWENLLATAVLTPTVAPPSTPAFEERPKPGAKCWLSPRGWLL